MEILLESRTMLSTTQSIITSSKLQLFSEGTWNNKNKKFTDS